MGYVYLLVLRANKFYIAHSPSGREFGEGVVAAINSFKRVVMGTPMAILASFPTFVPFV